MKLRTAHDWLVFRLYSPARWCIRITTNKGYRYTIGYASLEKAAFTAAKIQLGELPGRLKPPPRGRPSAGSSQRWKSPPDEIH